MMTDEDIREIQAIVEKFNRRYADKPVLSQAKLGEVRPADNVAAKYIHKFLKKIIAIGSFV